MTLTKLQRPLTRRIGISRLVVRVSKAGLAIRGYRRRRWRELTWEQVASLVDHEEFPIITSCEKQVGRSKLRAIGAAESVMNDE